MEARIGIHEMRLDGDLSLGTQSRSYEYICN